MSRSSLRTRGLVTVLAVVLPVLIVYSYLGHANVSYQLGRRLDGRMSHELTMLKEAVLRSEGDNQRLRDIVELMPIDSFPQRRLYGIWADEELVLSTEHLPFDSVPQVPAGYSDITAANTKWRMLAEFVPASPATAGRHITLAVVDPMAVRTALIRGGAIDQTLPVLIAAPILIIGIYLAMARSLQPLTRLADEIRNRSAERLEPVATQGVPREAMPIAESVNALMARLSESLDRERQFTADAAHELRTPLSALKAHAQVALRAQDEQLRLQSLQSIDRTVNRTDRLISQLLILARLDPQVARIQAETVDLGQIAAQVLVDLQSPAEARGHELRLNVQEPTVVRGSATALGILARNLIENAIQYSTEGEPIDVRVFSDGTHGILEVSDHGPGIPDADKQSVFGRFRRLPDAQGSGTGLGLSIVQRIAELHSAEVTLEDVEASRGLRARARIPM